MAKVLHDQVIGLNWANVTGAVTARKRHGADMNLWLVMQRLRSFAAGSAVHGLGSNAVTELTCPPPIALARTLFGECPVSATAVIGTAEPDRQQSA